MLRRSGLLVLLLCAALVVSALPAPAGPGLDKQTRRTAPTERPAEVLVKYRSLGKAAASRRRVHAKLVERLPVQALEVLQPAGSVNDAIAALEADPNVVYAEPNYLYEASSLTPNDPLFDQLWGLSQIRMPEAWTITRGTKDVTVAVVDSGLALGHPDLAPNVWRNPAENGSGKDSNGIDDDGNGYVDDWRGWDWIDDDNRPGDSHGHGSHVAGTIGAKGNDGFGVAGVNWDVNLMPLRVLDSTGVGTSGDIAAAFAYAGKLGVDVVNASFGGSGPSTAILEAVNAYPDTLFVVAAGNDGTNNDLQPQYPCSYTSANLICVAASDSSDNLAGFSNYGALSVDLAAPGVGILSAAPAKSQPFTETFETDITNRWVKGGVNNLWTRGIDTQGGYLSDSLGIDYLNDTDAWIATANAFSLSDQNDCKLHFAARIELERNKDVLLVEMSRDAQSWTRVGGWTGSSSGRWSTLTDDVSIFDGASSAYLRFRLRTNSSATAEGSDLDDVRIRCLSDSYSGNEFTSASGTSMAAPHVTGVAALLKATDPGASVAELAGAIMSGAETRLSLAGRVASSGRLDAVAALEHLTGSVLTEPDPLPEADPTPESDPTPEPLPTIEPQPDPTIEPEPEPEPVLEPSPEVGEEHQRAVGLRFKGGRYAQGRVKVATGYNKCRKRVPVKIKRNGKVIRKTTTNRFGFYKVRVPKRRGRYLAIAPTFEVLDQSVTQTCLRDRSPLRRR